MVTLNNLRYLSNHYLKDSEVLFLNNRFNGSIYLLGYAIELMLKWKISTTLGFDLGFPENERELEKYYSIQLKAFNSIQTGITLREIKQIKNHKLSELIKFSGIESTIIKQYNKEWTLICEWDPTKRYKRQHWTFKNTENFIKCSKRILSLIA